MTRKIYLSAFLIGLVSVALGYGVYLVTGKGALWGITTGESKIGGHLYNLLGLPVEQTRYYKEFKLLPVFSDPTQTIVIAILVGGAIPALLTGRYLIRHIPNRWMAAQAVAGGFLLGYGSRLALGCNIGNFLSAWTAAGINAITFTAALLIGTFVGFKVTEKIFIRHAAPLKFSYLPPKNLQIAAGVALVILAVVLSFLLKPLVGLFWAAGLAFGALGTVSGICFATCYRDLVARSYATGIMTRAIGLMILTFSTGVFLLQLFGIPFRFATPQISQLQIALGGFIFGAGIALAGSCIFSSEWRAGMGSIYSTIVLISTIFLGMPVLAIHYEWWLTVIPPFLPSFSLYSLNPTAAYLLPLTFSTALIVYGILVDFDARQTFARLIAAKPIAIKPKI